MRCLFLNFTLPRTGNYLRAKAFAQFFHEAGHLVTIASVSPWRRFRPEVHIAAEGAEIETPGWVPLQLVGRYEGWSPVDIAYRVVHLMRRHRYDLIYCFGHKPSTFLPALCAHLLGGIPVIYDWCDWWSGADGLLHGFVEKSDFFRSQPAPRRWAQRLAFRLEGPLERAAPRCFDAVTVISDFLRDRCRELGVEPLRVERLYTPADTEQFHGLSKEEARRRLRANPMFGPKLFQGTLVGMAAHVVHDAPVLWPAVRELADRHDVRFLLLGHGFERHPEWVDAPEYRGRVLAPGRLDNEIFEAALPACDLLYCPLLPTDYNRGRFPHKFFDYIAAGRPVIATDVGDIGRLTRDHRIGVSANGTTDFGQLILEGIAGREHWPEWGARARRLAETELSPETARERFNRLLLRTLGDRRTRSGEPFLI